MSTLNDVALRAGVSTSTASRAFREGASIKPEMQERVLKAAKELGYTPNLLARSLKSNKSNFIGLDICDIDNPFYTTIIKAMEEELKKKGYQLILSYSNGDYKVERKNLELFASTQAMGIAFMPVSSKNRNIVETLHQKGVAVIQLFNRTYDFVDTISVRDDCGAYRATKYLIENGHRRILLFNVCTPYSSDRADGYRRAMEEAGLPCPEDYIVLVEKPGEVLNEQFQELITRLKPTAIIAGVYSIGKNVIRACQRLHLKIPRDISMITVDDVEWPELLDITAVSPPIDYVGLSIVRMMEDHISGKLVSNQPVITTVEPELKIRGSVRKIKAEASGS